MYFNETFIEHLHQKLFDEFYFDLFDPIKPLPYMMLKSDFIIFTRIGSSYKTLYKHINRIQEQIIYDNIV
jgi:hypothetical protein